MGGETPGRAGNEALESETPARIRARVCGKTLGGLGLGIWGWGCRELVLVLWSPSAPGFGGLVPGPRVSRESVTAPQEGRESWAGCKARSWLGVGRRWT